MKQQRNTKGKTAVIAAITAAVIAAVGAAAALIGKARRSRAL